jgi:hypothetical protein
VYLYFLRGGVMSNKFEPRRRWVNQRVVADVDLIYLGIATVLIPLGWTVFAAVLHYVIGPQLAGLAGGAALQTAQTVLAGSFSAGLGKFWLCFQFLTILSSALVLLDRVHDEIHRYSHTLSHKGYASETWPIALKLYDNPRLEYALVGVGSRLIRAALVLFAGLSAAILSSAVPVLPTAAAFLAGCVIAFLPEEDSFGLGPAMRVLTMVAGVLLVPVVGAAGLVFLIAAALRYIRPTLLSTGLAMRRNQQGELAANSVVEDGHTAPGFYRRIAISPESRLVQWANDFGGWLKTTRGISLATNTEQFSDPENWSDAPTAGQIVRGARLDGNALDAALRREAA